MIRRLGRPGGFRDCPHAALNKTRCSGPDAVSPTHPGEFRASSADELDKTAAPADIPYIYIA